MKIDIDTLSDMEQEVVRRMVKIAKEKGKGDVYTSMAVDVDGFSLVLSIMPLPVQKYEPEAHWLTMKPTPEEMGFKSLDAIKIKAINWKEPLFVHAKDLAEKKK